MTHRKLRRWWDRLRAPWPIVGECFSSHLPNHACEQCQPSHAHVWRAWAKAPGWVTAGPGVPWRCKRCGARKCDDRECQEVRHDHTHVDGMALPVIHTSRIEREAGKGSDE